MSITCDICFENDAITKYKSGGRGKYWEYYCTDCDNDYGYENEKAGYSQVDIDVWQLQMGKVG